MSVIRDRATCSKCGLNKFSVEDGVCRSCRAGYPPQDGPFVNPETGQEYWPGEPGDPYLGKNLDEETDALEPKKAIGAEEDSGTNRQKPGIESP